METPAGHIPAMSPPRPTSSRDAPQAGEAIAAPRPQDVASTRHRAWHGHKQNVFYRGLIHQVAPTIDPNDGKTIKRASERIVDIIMIDKGGLFCKQVPDGWIVMDRKAAVVKAQSAIRNYHMKAAEGGWGGNKQRQKKAQATFKKKPPAGAKLASPTKKNHKAVLYQAQAGTMPIHPYALLLISAVCNQSKPKKVLRVLDSPLSKCFNNGEPAKERAMRLQVSWMCYYDCVFSTF